MREDYKIKKGLNSVQLDNKNVTLEVGRDTEVLEVLYIN